MFYGATAFNSDISKWNVPSVTDMGGMFQGASSFNADLTQWDVSRVTQMEDMFKYATAFDGDISNWDVSRVTRMDHMFFDAASFKQQLCGAAWVQSQASNEKMFTGSSGSISRKVCTSVSEPTAVTLGIDRKLIVHTPITTSVGTPAVTSTIAHTMRCLKCGTFEKSRRVSCCAPGGAWYKNCGGGGNRNVDHRWREGVEACKRKFEANGVR